MKKDQDRIYLIKIPKSPQKDLIKKGLLCLTEEENARFFKFKNTKDSLLYLTGRYFIKKIISEKIKTPIEKIIIKTTKFGRPILSKPKIKNFNFNISHSGDYVAVAISNKKIGVDIEKIKPIEMEIVKNYFAPEELKFIQKNKKNQLINFYKIWTLKESYIKAIGRGLSSPLKSFYFEINKNRIKINLKKKKPSYWHFKTYMLNEDYCLAICQHSQNKQGGMPRLREINTFLKK